MEIEKSTEEKILASAKKVFVVKGMAGARMQDIADEAGINKALLHYYFRSKEKLFEVIFKEAFRNLFHRINMVFESDLPFFDKIEKFCTEYITVMSENPFLPIFVLNEIHSNADRFLKNISDKKDFPKPHIFLAQVEKEIKKGTIKPIEPVQLLMNLLSMAIFPFVGRPFFQHVLKMDDQLYWSLIEKRKKEIPKFIIDSIKK